METLYEAPRLRWLDVMMPGRQDFEKLQQQFGFHELALEDCVTRMQRDKLDYYPDHLFVVLHYPMFDHENRRINSGQIGIFMGANYVVTVRNDESKVIDEMKEMLKNEESNLAQEVQDPPQLFYRILDRMVDKYFPMVDKISYNLEKVEQVIFENPSYASLKEISIIRRNILNFRKIIGPQRRLIGNLNHDRQKFLPEKLDIFFDDILDHIEKIWSQLESHREYLDSLSTTNESLISFRTNEVIKILTLFSVILMPLTLVSGIWGMNVAVPGEGEQIGFWFVISGMVGVLASMLMFFRLKKWL